MITAKRILYAEQDEDTADAVKYFLKEKGYEISISSHWQDTLRIIEKEQFDLILLDMLLPERPGKEAYSQIREYHEAHLALVSLFPISDRRQKYLESQGIAAVLKKPFSKNDLLSEVSKILEDDE